MDNQTVLRLTPTELMERWAAGERWQLIDVREPWEIAIAGLANAVAIPMAEIPVRMADLGHQEAVAVMCHTGVRSAAVAAWLAERGFSRVANVEGGIDAWSVEVDASIPRY